MGFTVDYLRLYSTMFRVTFSFARLRVGSVSQDFVGIPLFSPFPLKVERERKLRTSFRQSACRRFKVAKGERNWHAIVFFFRVVLLRHEDNVAVITAYHATATHLKTLLTWRIVSSRGRYQVFKSRIRLRLDIAIRHDSTSKHLRSMKSSESPNRWYIAY